jgi:hypothetical protein
MPMCYAHGLVSAFEQKLIETLDIVTIMTEIIEFWEGLYQVFLFVKKERTVPSTSV